MNAGSILYPALKNLVDGRVFQIQRLETAKDKRTPYIVYTPTTTTPESSQDGYTGYDWSRVQIDVYHSNYDQLDAVVEKILIAIATNIRPCDIGSRQNLYDSDSGLFRQSFDVEFFTEIKTPT